MSEERKLRKRLKEILKGKEKAKRLRTLGSYTTDEKRHKFDEFYQFAREILEAKMKGKPIKDKEHWCYEMVMKLLGDDVWEVYEGPIGKIDYKLVELGRKLQTQAGDVMVEICITQYGDAKQIHVYSFYDDGFSLQRWIKTKLNKAGY